MKCAFPDPQRLRTSLLLFGLVSSSGTGTSFSRHLQGASTAPDKTQASNQSPSLDEQDEVTRSPAAAAPLTK